MLRRTAIALILGCAATSPGWSQSPTKLRVGVEGSYPPFSQIGTDGKLQGFDIDIARAVCNELHAECTLVQQEFDGMIPALNARKFDMIVASLTITDERKKAVEFSDSYYDVPSRWIAKAGTLADPSPAALRGKTIVVLRNSPRARYLAEAYKDSTVLQADKETGVYMELAAGRADIALGSAVVSSEAFLKKPEGQGFAAVGQPVRIGTSGVGIAMRKADTDLRDRVNTALKAIRADGTYDRLQKQYFDFDISGS